MPSNMREEDLSYLFDSHGTIRSIRFLPFFNKGDKLKANIEMSSVHEGNMKKSETLKHDVKFLF